jgi:hypothetical protein
VADDVWARALAERVRLGDGRWRAEVARERLATPRSLHDEEFFAGEGVSEAEAEAELGPDKVRIAERAKADRQVAKGGLARRGRNRRAIDAQLRAILVVPAKHVGQNRPRGRARVPQRGKGRRRARVRQLVRQRAVQVGARRGRLVLRRDLRLAFCVALPAQEEDAEDGLRGFLRTGRWSAPCEEEEHGAKGGRHGY